MNSNRLHRAIALLVLIVSAVGSDDLADEIKNETAAKPNEARQKARDRTRRVIFNNDGGEPVVEMKTPAVQDFLDRRTTKLAGTHVDNIFYCSRTSGFGAGESPKKVQWTDLLLQVRPSE